jgi:hypothetical protein
MGIDGLGLLLLLVTWTASVHDPTHGRRVVYILDTMSGSVRKIAEGYSPTWMRG